MEGETRPCEGGCPTQQGLDLLKSQHSWKLRLSRCGNLRDKKGLWLLLVYYHIIIQVWGELVGYEHSELQVGK